MTINSALDLVFSIKPHNVAVPHALSAPPLTFTAIFFHVGSKGNTVSSNGCKMFLGTFQ